MARLLLLLFLMLSASPTVAADELRVVIVRHAEKAADGGRDPVLSAAGRERAQALAKLLGEQPPAAIYATQYRRTQLTAAPLARASQQRIHVRPAGESAASLATQVRNDRTRGTVLVVGHSNTVPALVEALSGQAIAAIGEDEYDHVFIVTVPAQGPARLESGRYPPTSP
jgi:broad specificity phosphatase PhoE